MVSQVDVKTAMRWRLSYRTDPLACEIMDRHYSRQVVGCGQVGGVARLLVLTASGDDGCALWITSWSQYDKHDWPGAWNCSAFRNEGAGRSSKLIRQAVAATQAKFGEPPEHGMITFVDAAQTRPKEHPGHSFIIAGFRPVGMTKGGLHVLQMRSEKMPKPEAPIEFQWRLIA
jgi:hypothetical protein